jgi:hypothetical protein
VSRAVEYEPGLVEEAVLAAVRGRPAEPAFRAERNPIYEIAEADERERRFRELHAAWFARLGLEAPLAGVLGEEPAATVGIARWLMARAGSRGGEGAELFVAGEGGARRQTVVVRVCPDTLADPGRFGAFLRREVAHLADMLDPRFGYTPGLGPVTGGIPDALLRERYRVLWDTVIDGRLDRLGRAAAGARAARLREFAAAFAMLGPRVEAAFERFFGAAAPTHAELMRFAVNPGGSSGRDGRRLWPGDACPLCRLPAHVFEPDPDGLPGVVREQIRGRHPRWQPADGLCRQCADLYRAGAAAASKG